MSLTADVNLVINAVHTGSSDLSSDVDTLVKAYKMPLLNGIAANQANQIFHDQRTLAASGNEQLDLAGGLTDVFGTAITFTKVRALIVHAASSNTNNVLVGGAAVNGFAAFVSDASDEVIVRPGGTFLITAPGSTGLAVTASTGDLLRIANSSSGTSVTYDIIIIGAAS